MKLNTIVNKTTENIVKGAPIAAPPLKHSVLIKRMFFAPVMTFVIPNLFDQWRYLLTRN